uniref:AlNc14C214G8976 protein n=1 Tax=Albugo laibachii Nc14 TaxID=890382 RepID=F0WRH4_9STRA|nr:AlNc14C214G8976 [Albugo laibachii Nc14]|eukprot:CCA23937.1 AlNc14C214G8976 [Albugo laibachii Nc14]
MFSRNIQSLIAITSAVTSLCLCILSGFGFKRLQNSSDSLANKTNFICLCVLGFLFGGTLALAELQYEVFYIYFGFLRFRAGRAILYVVAGGMTLVIGKNLNLILLIIEGVACLVISSMQVVALFYYGNRVGGPSECVQPPKENVPISRPVSRQIPVPVEKEVYLPPVFTPPPTRSANVSPVAGAELPTWMQAS